MIFEGQNKSYRDYVNNKFLIDFGKNFLIMTKLKKEILDEIIFNIQYTRFYVESSTKLKSKNKIICLFLVANLFKVSSLLFHIYMEKNRVNCKKRNERCNGNIYTAQDFNEMMFLLHF